MSNGVNFKDLCIDLRGQLDRVTAERDAALGREADLFERNSELRDLHAKQCCVFCNDTGNLRAVNATLQQRLTAADEELKQCQSMALMIEEKEWAEHVGRGPISSQVESAFTQLHNELSEARQGQTAADERVDVLEGQLAKSERKRRDFVAAVKVETDQIEAKHSRCVVVPEGYVVVVVPINPTKAMRDACQIAGKLPVWAAMVAAALKTAEGSTCNQIREESGLPTKNPCQACGNGACIDL